MIKTLLKHKIFEVAINTMFDGLIFRFPSANNKIYIKGKHINDLHVGMRVIGVDYFNVDFTKSLLTCEPIIEIGPPRTYIQDCDCRADLIKSMHMRVASNIRGDFTDIYSDNIYTLI